MLRYVQIPYDPTSWGAVVNTYPSAEVYHSPEWLAFLQATKGVALVVAEIQVEAGHAVGHFVGGITSVLGLRVLGSPLSGWGTNVMGFLLRPGIDRREAAIALLGFAYRELGCVHVEVRDRASDVTGIQDSPYTVTRRETLEVDLTGSEEDVVSRMHSRTRTYVRRASRIGLIVDHALDVGIADEYYAQLVDVFSSQSLVPTYGIDRIRSLVETVGPSGQLSMLRLRSPDGEPVGSIVTVGRNSRAALWGLAWYRSAAKLHPVEIAPMGSDAILARARCGHLRPRWHRPRKGEVRGQGPDRTTPSALKACRVRPRTRCHPYHVLLTAAREGPTSQPQSEA